jgi:hypothetical protein
MVRMQRQQLEVVATDVRWVDVFLCTCVVQTCACAQGVHERVRDSIYSSESFQSIAKRSTNYGVCD